jgi:hypothetical protein
VNIVLFPMKKVTVSYGIKCYGKCFQDYVNSADIYIYIYIYIYINLKIRLDFYQVRFGLSFMFCHLPIRNFGSVPVITSTFRYEILVLSM